MNSTFSVALVLVHDALVDADVVVQLPSDGAAVWTTSAPEDECPKADVLNAAFVDDTVLILLASSARALEASIGTLLKVLLRIYHFTNIEINWNP